MVAAPRHLVSKQAARPCMLITPCNEALHWNLVLKRNVVVRVAKPWIRSATGASPSGGKGLVSNRRAESLLKARRAKLGPSLLEELVITSV